MGHIFLTKFNRNDHIPAIYYAYQFVGGPLGSWGPRLKSILSIGKSGTGYVQQPGDQTWNGGLDFKCWSGHHWTPLATGLTGPPLPLSTDLFLLYDNTGLLWCAIWVYLKSLNGSPACDCWTQTSWQVRQRDSDTVDSGKPHIVI